MKRNIMALVLGGSFFVPALAPADDAVPQKRPTSIVVHLSGDATGLHGVTSDGFGVTCAAPCDRAVPADPTYVATTTSGASQPFSLDRDEKKLDVSVTRGSPLRGAGVALTVLGGIAAVTGATLFAYGAMDHVSYGVAGSVYQYGAFLYPTETNEGPNHVAMIAGGVTAGIGVAALITGLVLFSNAKKPQVVQTAIHF